MENASNSIDNLLGRLEPLTHGVQAAPQLVRLRLTGSAIATAAAGIRKQAAGALNDSTKTQDARRLHAANTALKLAKPALDEYQQGAHSAREQLGRIGAQVRQHLLPRDSEEARELRQAVMALPSQERLNVLEAAAQSQDWEVIRAVAGAHPLLTRSIPEGFVGHLTDTYLHAVAPDLVVERDRLTEAVSVLDVMAGELQRLVKHYDTEQAQALREQVSALAAETA
jgi:hypothetical protein